MLMTRPRLISPTPVAAIALAILAFTAPCSRAHARSYDEPIDPIAKARRPPPPDLDDDPLDESIAPTTPVVEHPPYLPERSRWSQLRLFAAAGVRFGSFTINGDGSGTAIPFHLDLGVRVDRWLAFASYDVFGVSARVPALGSPDAARSAELPSLGDGSGLAHRVGVAARYTLSRFGESDGGLDFWAEGGLGVEHLRWDAGGTLTRPDLSLGIGATVIYLGRHRHSGITMGLRVTIAPRNDDTNAPPTCGGPCDTATPPASLDRSFLFDITIPFGT